MGVHDPYASRQRRKALPPITEDERFMWERRRYGLDEAKRRADVRALATEPHQHGGKANG